jgi:hypothetical protein
MKKVIFTLLFSVYISALFAQFSLSVTGGYCLPIASSYRTKTRIEFQNQNFPNYYTTQESLSSASFGQGGNIALALDWFSKKNIGCGLKLNALISSPYTSTASVYYLNGSAADFTFVEKPFSFQFIPHISFKHDFKKVSPIVEMGMIIGITNIKEDYHAESSSGGVLQSSINSSGGALVGFYSSLGLAIRMSRTARFMIGLTCSAGSYSPTKWERKSYVVNGQDQMQYLSTSQTQGTFVKQLDLKASQPSGQPDQELKYSAAFSNVGINIGFSFVLAKRQKPTDEKSKQLQEERTRKLWQDTY